jgi:hypothetical protein
MGWPLAGYTHTHTAQHLLLSSSFFLLLLLLLSLDIGCWHGSTVVRSLLHKATILAPSSCFFLCSLLLLVVVVAVVVTKCIFPLHLCDSPAARSAS